MREIALHPLSGIHTCVDAWFRWLRIKRTLLSYLHRTSDNRRNCTLTIQWPLQNAHRHFRTSFIGNYTTRSKPNQVFNRIGTHANGPHFCEVFALNVKSMGNYQSLHAFPMNSCPFAKRQSNPKQFFYWFSISHVYDSLTNKSIFVKFIWVRACLHQHRLPNPIAYKTTLVKLHVAFSMSPKSATLFDFRYIGEILNDVADVENVTCSFTGVATDSVDPWRKGRSNFVVCHSRRSFRISSSRLPKFTSSQMCSIRPSQCSSTTPPRHHIPYESIMIFLIEFSWKHWNESVFIENFITRPYFL